MSSSPPVDISCVDCFNSLVHCFSPSHQLDRYYKDGGFTQCRKQLDDLKMCMKLKVASPEEARDIVRKILAAEKSPTEGVVWKERGTKNPGF